MTDRAQAKPTDADLFGRTQPFPRGIVVSGFLVILVLVGSLGVWAKLAPIEGAVVSPGIVSVASYRKQVQHLEGGIVESILVSDGDQVAQGQLLVRLRDVKATATLRQIEGQYAEVQAVIARLEAESEGREIVDFPLTLSARANDPSIRSILAGQQAILDSNRSLANDKAAVLDQRIAQAAEEIGGIEGSIASKERQLRLIREELSTVDAALRKGLTPKAESLRLRQREAQVSGELSALKADLGRLQQNILETRLQNREFEAQRSADISGLLRTQRALLFDLSQKLVQARDVADRTRIVAPMAGTVVNLQVHSLDGVIDGGQPLLEIVPAGDELVIEAFIDPEDIDEVTVGMPADVRLTAASRRQRIPLPGVVTRLSADRISDPQTGRDHYRARIELSAESKAASNLEIMAGMGADVFIRTGSRTPFDYLLSPLTDSLQLAMRER